MLSKNDQNLKALFKTKANQEKRGENCKSEKNGKSQGKRLEIRGKKLGNQN